MIGSGSRNPGHPSSGIDPSSIPIPTARGGGDDSRPAPMASADPYLPLLNLSVLGQRMDSLRRFLSDSIDRRAPLAGDQLQLVSAEIASVVHQTILNGAAFLASFQPSRPNPTAGVDPAVGRAADHQIFSGPDPASSPVAAEEDGDAVEEEEEEGDIVEIDAAELLAEHVHFCEICGKGFKRDANLRMHMRAHGNQFKTLEALSKPPEPDGGGGGGRRKVRFSCPVAGCNRNRCHGRFRPLKSVVCVKNHFKRSHRPKTYSCHRCSKKSFSVMADLKSHLKHCGESRWRCSCGTSFSRKDKLFGHVALFEGHLPAVGAGEEEEEEGKTKALVVGGGEDIERGGGEPVVGESFDLEFFERLMKELEGIEGGNY